MTPFDDVKQSLEGFKESDNQYINVAEAKAFIGTCSDPITQAFLWHAFSVLTFRVAHIDLTGKFDVLFFMRALAEMATEREMMLQIFSGQFVEE